MPKSFPLSHSSPTPMAQRGYLGPSSSSGRLILATDSSKDLETFFKKQKSSETKLRARVSLQVLLACITLSFNREKKTNKTQRALLKAERRGRHLP